MGLLVGLLMGNTQQQGTTPALVRKSRDPPQGLCMLLTQQGLGGEFIGKYLTPRTRGQLASSDDCLWLAVDIARHDGLCLLPRILRVLNSEFSSAGPLNQVLQHVVPHGGVHVEEFVAGRWNQLGSPTKWRQYYACATMGENLLCMTGGMRGLKMLDSIGIFDLTALSWTEGPPMLQARGNHSCTEFDGKLHVVGGWGTSQHEEEVLLDSVEVYDAAAGCWNLVDEASAAAVRQLVLVSDASNASHAERNKSFVYEYPSCREKPSKHHALHVASAQRHVAVLGFSD